MLPPPLVLVRRQLWSRRRVAPSPRPRRCRRALHRHGCQIRSRRSVTRHHRHLRPRFPCLPKLTPSLLPWPQGLLAKRLSEPIVVGGVALRPGMPLTELSPQLPQLAAQVALLAEQIVSAEGGNRLLDDLAKAAAAGTTAGKPAAQLSTPAQPCMHTRR